MIVGMCRMKKHHGSLCSKTLLWVTHLVFMVVALAIELAVLISFCKADVGVAFYEVGKGAGTMAVIYCIVNSFVVMFLLGRYWVLSKSKWHKHLGSESEWASKTSSAKNSTRG